MKPIRTLLVDDHRLVRQGIRAILDADARFEVVGEASSGAEALRLAAESAPDVVLLDIQLPDKSGVDVCEAIVRARPETVVLILTAFIDKSLVDACLRAGAKGYLLKDAEDLRLQEQILLACAGHSALDPRAVDVLADFVRQSHTAPQVLTAREIQILRLTSAGLTNKQIAAEMFLSENTIKAHLKEILAKTGTHNRVQAVLVAKERGLI